MKITIRHALRNDCPRLMELVRELAEYERASQEVTVTMEHFEQSGFGQNPIWWAFVAETEVDNNPSKKIIEGFALYYIRYSTWKGQAMYLEDILVSERMRGHGIGKLLFDALILEAKEKKLNRIIWQVLEWNEPAINFYKKFDTQFYPEWINCIMSVSQD